jgi:hypothetical protein
MPEVFFLSYARPRSERAEDIDRLIREFHADLQSKLASHIQDQPRGFIDTLSLKAGTPDWEADLTAALHQYPIGIALIHPDYLSAERPWCRWECKFLEERNQAIGKFRELLKGEVPSTLLLLNWAEPVSERPHDYPHAIQGVGRAMAGGHLEEGDAMEHVERHGLASVMTLRRAGEAASATRYERVLQCMARYVAAQWRLYQVLLERQLDLPHPGRFDGQRWTYASSRRPPEPSRAQRRKVFVVYVAAKPNEAPDERAVRYRESGESDWRPFANRPSDPAHAMHVDQFFDTLADDWRVEKWALPYFDRDMASLLDNHANHPLVLVVDPWTTSQRQSYRQLLDRYSELEKTRGTVCTPLMILDNQEPDYEELSSLFSTEVQSSFEINRWEFFHEPETLHSQLHVLVDRMQSRIRMKRSVSLPRTGSAPPRLNPNAPAPAAGCGPTT